MRGGLVVMRRANQKRQGRARRARVDIGSQGLAFHHCSLGESS